MNSRERVLAAVNHREPDRVPIDLGGTRQSGIAASTCHRAQARVWGSMTPTRVYDVYQMLAEVERPVMERFGADVDRAESTGGGVWDCQRGLEALADVRRYAGRGSGRIPNPAVEEKRRPGAGAATVNAGGTDAQGRLLLRSAGGLPRAAPIRRSRRSIPR